MHQSHNAPGASERRLSGLITLPRLTFPTAHWSAAYLWALFYLMPFADAATGFMVLSGRFPEAAAGSISQFLRAALIIPALLVLKGRWTYAAALPMLYVLALESFMLVLHGQPSWFLVSVIYDFKVVYLVVAYLALRELVNRQHQTLDITRYFVRGATLYGAILLLSTLAGWHTPTYGEGTAGTKGLFASGNALGFYLGCAALVALDNAPGATRRQSSIEAAFLIFCCLLVGTKASLIFTALFAALVLYRASWSWKAVLITVACAGFVLYSAEIVAAFGLLFDVILFRYERSESLFAFMASSRDAYVREAFAVFNPTGWGVWRLLFGAGSFVSFRDVDAEGLQYDTLESDFFDIGFAYGAIGLALYLAVIAYGIVLALRARRGALLLAWSATAFYSAAAGHMAFNAMSGLAFPVLLIALQQIQLRRPLPREPEI